VANTRPDRVGEQIRVELTELIAREVHDPGVGFVTLTKVKVSPDLQLARIYYTTFGDANAQKESAKALKRATPFLRRQVAQRVRLRRAPELEFFYDESIAQHDRIEQILQELKTEAASRGEGAPVTEPDEPRAESPASREGAAATEPRERNGDQEVPAPRPGSGRPEHESKGASKRVGGSRGAEPAGKE
jgi:ribosome-binding factor A